MSSDNPLGDLLEKLPGLELLDAFQAEYSRHYVYRFTAPETTVWSIAWAINRIDDSWGPLLAVEVRDVGLGYILTVRPGDLYERMIEHIKESIHEAPNSE